MPTDLPTIAVIKNGMTRVAGWGTCVRCVMKRSISAVLEDAGRSRGPVSLFYDSVPESQEDVVAYLLFLFGCNSTIPLT